MLLKRFLSDRLLCERENLGDERYFAMTVDVDGWSSLLRFYSVDHVPEEADSQVNVDKGICRLLRLFERHCVKATFFFTGEMAEKHSSSVREVIKAGHEVACHGLTHDKDEFVRNEKSQRHSIVKATKILEEATGHQPLGFRAPCLRFNEITLKVLNECEYLYDSSVVPTFVPGYYGVPFASTKPYYHADVEWDGSLKLLEIPVSVNPFIPLPLSAAWMRVLGFRWVKFGIKANFLSGNPVVLYVHPRDVLDLPKIRGVPWHLRKNTGDSAICILDEIIGYTKDLGARFLRCIEIAEIFGEAG